MLAFILEIQMLSEESGLKLLQAMLVVGGGRVLKFTSDSPDPHRKKAAIFVFVAT